MLCSSLITELNLGIVHRVLIRCLEFSLYQNMKRKTRTPSTSAISPEVKKKKKMTGEESSECSTAAMKCLDFTSPVGVVESLLSPTELESFFSDNWEKKPLVIKRGNADFYGSLFSMKDFLALLKREELQFVEDINISRFVENKTETMNGEGRVNLKDMKSDGVAIRFSQPQRFQVSALIYQGKGKCV